MSTMHCSLLSLGCVFGFVSPKDRITLTALHAFKIAQRRLRPEVRAKLMSVSSAPTDGSLIPEAWRFVFHDQGTSGHCRVVTVAARASSEHPDTVEAFGSSKLENVMASHTIVQNKLLVDSDRVLELARGMSKLKGVQSAEYRLIQQRNSQEPLWALHFYAEAGEPVVRFQVGAKTGAIEMMENGSKKVEMAVARRA